MLKIMSSLLVFLIFLSFVCVVKSNLTINGTVYIDGKSPIANTDENFVCATLDWWPPESCLNGICSWGGASLLTLDLKNNHLINAVKAFAPLRLRMGGTLQDQVIYQTEDKIYEPCLPFAPSSTGLHEFTSGCLPLARWDEINSFIKQSGAIATFGLNALYGKTVQPNKTATGRWISSNSEALIRYTIFKGYKIYGWELGNELGGWPIELSVAPVPYALDTIALHNLLQDIYQGVDVPKILAPGGIYTTEYRDWFAQYVPKTNNTLNVLTHHIYNIGLGTDSDEYLIKNILDPSYLDEISDTFRNLKQILENSGTSTVAGVSESGGIARSGRNGVSNTFVNSFWYLDLLGISSIYGTKTFCRQTLVGGNYALLNTTTFEPNPDYYSALLWHRLMGSQVLSTKFTGTKMIRAYAHCSKQSDQGITLLLINLDGNTTVNAKIYTALYQLGREEYHLTPLNGNIQSRTMLLNGKALTVGSSGTIPELKPIIVPSREPVKVAPHSIVFVHMPNVLVQACTQFAPGSLELVPTGRQVLSRE